MAWLVQPSTTRSMTSISRGVRRSSRLRSSDRDCSLDSSSNMRASARLMAASKCASSTGFSMKSSAPALMAATAIGTSAWPEIRTTGRVMLRRGSSRTSSMPSMPGMRTSATMQPVLAAASLARKASCGLEDVDAMAKHAQHLAQRLAHGLLIVDDENGRHGHVRSPASPRAARSGIRSRLRSPTCSQMRPPCACTMEAQIDRPSPSPSPCVDDSGSNSGRPAGTPTPLSVTLISIADASLQRMGADADGARRDGRPRRWPRRALCTRLSTTCCNWMRSPKIAGRPSSTSRRMECLAWPRPRGEPATRASSSTAVISRVLKCGRPRRRKSRMRRTTPAAWSIWAMRLVRLASARLVSARAAAGAAEPNGPAHVPPSSAG